MEFSRFNIISKIRDSKDYFLVNLLSGNADILSPAEAKRVETVRKDTSIPSGKFYKELAEKGYFVEGHEEYKTFKKRYLDFIEMRENDEIQIFFIPDYSCNFACSYCYQDEYQNPAGSAGREVIDAFFYYIKREFTSRRKYITIFGGEPLLNSRRQKETISYIADRSVEYGLDLCIVTNGYALEDYTDILKRTNIREIQVTLDGTEHIHNNRRFLKGGGVTFDKIVRGIDLCLENQININLRMVLDRENIDNLPDLAGFAIEKGWTSRENFKVQIGRNYELHHCQNSSKKLFDRLSMYESILALSKKHPHIRDFYRPAYSITKFLSENGELPDPLFDSCPACKTEWAFDYTGKIYPCTATVGKPEESLGTFFPEVTRNDELIEQWEGRDVTSISDCRECSVRLACGGGCGSLAKNRNGEVCTPDCRPVRELMELGFSEYFEKR